MYIARILYPVHVLGPGQRIGIWFNGCTHGCHGCSNPELWEPQQRYKTTLETVMGLVTQICQKRQVDGFTLTGGDPFFQPKALGKLLGELTKITPDILVYTGYELDMLRETYPELLSMVGVLIDGRYIEERNTGLPLRGSDNQNIIILKDELREEYCGYLSTVKNEIENFTTLDGVISVGIHQQGYEAQVDALLKQKGLETI